MFCYDITKQEHFEGVKASIEECKHNAGKDIVGWVVGCKVDLDSD